MASTTCQTPNGAPEFKWSPDIYLGDSETQSIVRKHEGKVYQIMASDPRFDSMVAMHNSEIKKAKRAAFDVINECERWRSPQAEAQAIEILGSIQETEEMAWELR